MVQLVEALSYKPEGRGFDSRWCHCNFFVDINLPDEYQEYFLEGKGGRCVGLTTLTPSRADFMKSGSPNILEPPRACPGL